MGCALRKGVVWGCAGAQRGAQQRGAAQGCSSVGLRRGAAVWGCAGVQSSVGLRRGAAAWGCTEQLCGAAQWWGGCVGA